jgi:hypothetical protein
MNSEIPTPRTEEAWELNDSNGFREFTARLERDLIGAKELVRLLEDNPENFRELFDKFEATKIELRCQQQIAANNSDWFDNLVGDLAKILQCDPKPHVILEVVKHLKK